MIKLDKFLLIKKQERLKKRMKKANILAGIGLSWLCMTKKKTIWRSEIIEIMSYFNKKENIGYKSFLFYPLRILEMCDLFEKEKSKKK